MKKKISIPQAPLSKIIDWIDQQDKDLVEIPTILQDLEGKDAKEIQAYKEKIDVLNFPLLKGIFQRWNFVLDQNNEILGMAIDYFQIMRQSDNIQIVHKDGKITSHTLGNSDENTEFYYCDPFYFKK